MKLANSPKSPVASILTDNSPAGVMNEKEAKKQILAIATGQNNCELYFEQVSELTNADPRTLYYKIMDTNPGSVDLIAMIGDNTSQAYYDGIHIHFVFNFKTGQVKRVATLQSGKETQVPSMENPGSQGQSAAALGKKTRSIQPITNRQEIIGLLAPSGQINVSKKTAPGITPPSFNTDNSNIPPKDYAAIFDDANLNLYVEAPMGKISVGIPGGAAKFITLGVDTDRPSIILSSQLNPIIYSNDLSKELIYDQLVMDRHLRLQVIYENLNKVRTEDFSSNIENYSEFVKKTKKSIESISLISEIDNKILVDVISFPKSIATDFLKLKDSYSLSQIYLQTLFDLGRAHDVGYYGQKTSGHGPREIGGAKPHAIVIDRNADEDNFILPIVNMIGASEETFNISNPLDYNFGSYGNFLAFMKTYEAPDLIGNSDQPVSLGTPNLLKMPEISSHHTKDKRTVSIMQKVYSELVFSRLVHEGNETIIGLKNSGSGDGTPKNLADFLLEGVNNSGKSLNSVSIATKLTSILKFNYAGTNYFPFEESIAPGTGTDGRTFLDAIIQPAVGSLIEGEEIDFDLLNKWTENADSELNNLFKYTDILNLEGGSAIVLNEILLSIIKCITDLQHAVGKRHSNINQLGGGFPAAPTNGDILAIFNACAENFSASTDDHAFANVKNTFSSTPAKGIDKMLRNMMAYRPRISLEDGTYTTAPYPIGKVWFGLSAENVESMLTGIELATPLELQAFAATHGIDLYDHLYLDDFLQVGTRVYLEFSRLFASIESGLMTSVELLLADAGLISSAPKDYSTEPNTFFTDRNFVKMSSIANGSKDISHGYQATAFSGIPRFSLRVLIAECVSGIIDADIIDSPRSAIGTAKMAVENLDPSLGPVRWKVTHGKWPLEKPGFTDISSQVANKIFAALPTATGMPTSTHVTGMYDPDTRNVDNYTEKNDSVPPHTPSELEQATTDMINMNMEQMAQSELDKIQSGNEDKKKAFVDSTAGFCPTTLMLDQEDNSKEPFSFVTGNRSFLNGLFKEIVAYRTKIYKIKDLLSFPIQAYKEFPDSIEKSIAAKSLEPFIEMAKIPGIDASQIVKFANPMHVINARKSLRTESASSMFNYLPNRLIISSEEYNTARLFLKQYINKNFKNRSDLVLQQVVGIPSGYLQANNRLDMCLIQRNALFTQFPNTAFSAVKSIFHSQIFLIPGSLKLGSSIQQTIENSKYLISTKTLDRFFSYSEVQLHLSLSALELNKLLMNHVIDYCLKLTSKITTGLDLSEDNFRVDELANKKYLSSEATGLIPNILTNVPTGIVSELGIGNDSINESGSIYKSLPNLTANEINSFLGSTDCRLISPEMLVKSCLTPRVFDRVFCFLVHPSEHYASEIQRGLYENQNSPNANATFKYSIALDPNDSPDGVSFDSHLASYFYKVL